MPRIKDLVRLQLEKIVKGGDCIAHLEGNVYFVHYGLPGETVIAQVRQIRKSVILADVVEVIVPSSHRIKPKCPFFGPTACGGCDFQHSELIYQRELKKDIIRQCLNFIGHLNTEFELLPAYPQEDGTRWRNRIRLAIDENGAVGMRQRHSHQVIPIKDCLISQVDLTDLAELKEKWPAGSEIELLFSAQENENTALSKVSCYMSTKDKIDKEPGGKYFRKTSAVARYANSRGGSARHTSTQENSFLFFQVKDFNYRVSPLSFFQIHQKGVELLLDTVLNYADPQPGAKGVDLYSGVGLFSLPLAKAVEQKGSIIAIESNIHAVRDAEYNLRHLPQAKVLHASVTALALRKVDPDFIVVDPPRSGIDKGALETLLSKKKLIKIVYVSCDPATFARDAKIITEAGWDMKRFIATDMFPMTAHMETIALFEKANGDQFTPFTSSESKPTARDAAHPGVGLAPI